MSRYQVAYNPTTKVATVQAYGDATLAGSTNIGDFYHGGGGVDVLDPVSDNHVIFHHVQDLLYRNGKQNMQDKKIVCKRLTAMTSSPDTTTKAAAATQQITNTFTPADAANRKVTYTSSDITKATVSASGLITAVATGSATITVTAEDGGWQDTVAVTVS